ncbi:MAG: helix-turn-helix transcriptional regulator [Caldilineaceae bacterium SB0661_bin_32]|uniref:Helix-turn-helix transcriptional regulator n=1 Tax=Caldilineaceae bacterium SB0661_bin_32 TaxID=2605255 RepID=A0A6B1DBU9_9CHLR|nr:helix-turn-helix transcriptional regulator [Caldilineaceae bacterium SB0661_bin_32]
MIKNERQYLITKAQADRFSEALRKLDSGAADQSERHPPLLAVQKKALQSQLSDLEADIREYEVLKAGNFAFEQLASISELPKLLISARIASGLSQRGLADRLGVKEQQIQRYEANDYASASLARIKKVVSALGIESDVVSREDHHGER